MDPSSQCPPEPTPFLPSNRATQLKLISTMAKVPQSYNSAAATILLSPMLVQLQFKIKVSLFFRSLRSSQAAKERRPPNSKSRCSLTFKSLHVRFLALTLQTHLHSNSSKLLEQSQLLATKIQPLLWQQLELLYLIAVMVSFALLPQEVPVNRLFLLTTNKFQPRFSVL